MSLHDALMAKAFGGGSGGGGVSSWNDLTDKPFYSETAEILPETTVEIDPEMSMGFIPVDFTVEDGKEYTVKYNGVEYVTSCLATEGEFLLGNGGALAEGLPVTDDPFALAYTDFGDGIMKWAVAALDGSASVTLSVVGELVTKISDEYMPDSTKAYYVKVISNVDGTHFTEATPEELVKAYHQGRPVFLTAGDMILQLSCLDKIEGRVEFFTLNTQEDGGFIIVRFVLTNSGGVYTVKQFETQV